MRKIESKLWQAWQDAKPVKIDNSEIVVQGPRVYLKLFDNTIAFKDISEPFSTTVTLAGWNTLTTRSRLKSVIGAPVSQMRKAPYLGGVKIDPDKWYGFYSKEEVPAPFAVQEVTE